MGKRFYDFQSLYAFRDSYGYKVFTRK